MNEIDECPPWKRRKVIQQRDEETGIVSHQVPEYKIWIPDRLNHVIAELPPEARETLALCRTVMGILNKLTWENFEKLTENMKNLRIDTPTKIQLVVDMIHKRAIVEWNYRILYVRMCDILRKAQVNDDLKSVQSFSTCLIAKCEEFFTQSLRQDVYFCERKKAIDSCVDKILKKSAKEAYEFEESVFRKNLLGNCEFIGELYNMKIIHSGIIFDMLNRLSKATLFVSVQCVCTLISTVGLFYEQKNGKFPEKYFDKLKSVLESDNVPGWIRYHIEELLDLRYRNWRPRKLMGPTIPAKKCNQELKPNQETISQTELIQKSEIDQDEVQLIEIIQKTEKNQEEVQLMEIQEPEMNQDEVQLIEIIQKSEINLDEVQLIEIIRKSEMNQAEVQLQSFKNRVCKALDSLTPDNIEIQIVTVTPLVNVLELEYLVDAIFQKAISLPENSKLYAKLCNIMGSFRVPIGDDGSNYIEFKTAVLGQCEKLLDKLGAQKLEKIRNKIRRKASDNYQFIIELSKAKILTPEFNFHLCIKLIEFGIKELIEFVRLRDLLKVNGKEILLKLKEQGRYEELFQFLDKLHHISKIEKKDKKRTFISCVKSDLRKFIYGVEIECCIIQDIVHLGPIPSMKEFTSTMIFWYFRVLFNECRLKAKKAPEWVSSQKNMCSSTAALHEAVSQLLTYAISGNDFIAARSGLFFIYLIKWGMISPQDVIDGLSILLKSIIQDKKKRDPLKIITNLLFKSEYFKFDDLKKVLPKALIPKPEIKNEEIEVEVVPIPPVANDPGKLIQDLIQLQLSFEDRIHKALDGLTFSNIENQIFLMIPLVNELQFVYVVDSIFQNAIYKPDKCELYAKLCYDMWSFRAPREDAVSGHVEFKTVVLRKCQQLLDEFQTKESVGSNEMYRIAIGNFRLITELSKMKAFTTEFIFLLISKLIDLRNEELFEWLSELLPANWKTILLKLKEQGRYDEIFQFFDKLEHLLKDTNYNSTSDAQWKSAFRKFIYGVENECFIQEIVFEGAITSIREFTPTMLFWYFKVCFNHCNLKAKKPPEWVSSQKNMFSSSKALPEAISQFNMSINILNDNFTADRAGQFFIYLIKWCLVSPQNVIDGLSCILKPRERKQERKRLKLISRYLHESGYFEFDDLKKLFEDLVTTAPDTQIPTTSPNTSHVNLEIENRKGNFGNVAIIPQLAETLGKRQILKKIFLDASKYVPPSSYHFNPSEFQSQVKYILFDDEDMETAASCLIEVVMMYPDLYEFYATVICSSMFNMIVKKKQFWTVLMRVCCTYCDQLLFSNDDAANDGNSTGEEESSVADESTTEPAPMAVINWPARNQGRCTIYVPMEAFNTINNMNPNLTDSFCPQCSSKTHQLEEINKTVECYRTIMAHLKKRVSIQPIQQSTHSGLLARHLCTIYMPQELHNKLLAENKPSKNILPVCFSCGLKNEVLDNLILKLKCIEGVMEYINFQVDFKLDRGRLQTVKKRISIEKKTFCSLVNICALNNKVANDVVQHQMQRLLNTHRIDFFYEMYFNLDLKKDRLEKSLFIEKIPEVLSNGELDYKHREMLDDVLQDLTSISVPRLYFQNAI